MIKKILLIVIGSLVITVGGLTATGHGYILTAFTRVYMQGNNTANINDYQQFDTRVIAAGDPQPLPEHPDKNTTPLSPQFLASVDQYGVAAFLVLQNGEVLAEHYFNGYNERSKTNSFSMAKTVLTLLVGKAVEDGIIESFDQPIVELIPEFAADPLAQTATLAHLSLMNSGYEWTEHYYSPFSPTVELLYGPDIEEFLTQGFFSAKPGSFWEYSSASTQLLGIALKRALDQAGNNLTISEYLSQTLWQPLGMNDDALWHLDGVGMELVFCCINTNARNYAKLGELMRLSGTWNETSIINPQWVEKMIEPVGQSYYGASTWLGIDKTPAHYYFSGHLGQFVIVVPEHDLTIVRLGESMGSPNDVQDATIPTLIREGLRQVNVQL